MGAPVLLQSLGNGVIWDGQGNGLNGHAVYVYARGTTTQISVYSDSALTQVMSQPLATGSWIVPGSGQTVPAAGSIPGYVATSQEIDFYDATAGIRMPGEPVAAGSFATVTWQQPPPTGIASVDTANLQEFFASAPAGTDIVLSAGGTYSINEPIEYPAGHGIYMAADPLAQPTIIQQCAGANLSGGLLVPQGWATNGTVSDHPVHIHHLCIDGNFAANPSSTAACLIVMNDHSHVERNFLINAPGHGLLITDTTINGTNVITGTATECVYEHNKIAYPGGDGIHVTQAGLLAFSDAVVDTNWVKNTGQNPTGMPGSGWAVWINDAAGWQVIHNHTYGVALGALYANHCYGTLVMGNEFEDFAYPTGTAAALTASAFYQGIYVLPTTIEDANDNELSGVRVIGNTISCPEGSNSVGGYQYVVVQAAGNGVHAVVLGNAIGSAGLTTLGTGLKYQSTGSDVLYVNEAANRIYGMHTLKSVGANVKIMEEDSIGNQHPRTNANVSLSSASGCSSLTLTTQTPNDCKGGFSFGTFGTIGQTLSGTGTLNTTTAVTSWSNVTAPVSGASVSGTNVPANTFVVPGSVASGGTNLWNFTLSNAATGSGSVTLTIVNPCHLQYSFDTAYAHPVQVLMFPMNAASEALGAYATGFSGSFQLFFANQPPPSQPAGTYLFTFMVIE